MFVRSQQVFFATYSENKKTARRVLSFGRIGLPGFSKQREEIWFENKKKQHPTLDDDICLLFYLLLLQEES